MCVILWHCHVFVVVFFCFSFSCRHSTISIWIWTALCTPVGMDMLATKSQSQWTPAAMTWFLAGSKPWSKHCTVWLDRRNACIWHLTVLHRMPNGTSSANGGTVFSKHFQSARETVFPAIFVILVCPDFGWPESGKRNRNRPKAIHSTATVYRPVRSSQPNYRRPWKRSSRGS